MKRLLFLIVLLCAIQAQAQTFYGDTLGATIRWFPGRGLIHPIPNAAWRVPAVDIPSIPGANIQLQIGSGRTADTVIIERRFTALQKRDTAWYPQPFLDKRTGLLDSSGTILFAGPYRAIQVYDLSPQMQLRIRVRTLRPATEQVSFSVQ